MNELSKKVNEELKKSLKESSSPILAHTLNTKPKSFKFWDGEEKKQKCMETKKELKRSLEETFSIIPPPIPAHINNEGKVVIPGLNPKKYSFGENKTYEKYKIISNSFLGAFLVSFFGCIILCGDFDCSWWLMLVPLCFFIAFGIYSDNHPEESKRKHEELEKNKEKEEKKDKNKEKNKEKEEKKDKEKITVYIEKEKRASGCSIWLWALILAPFTGGIFLLVAFLYVIFR